MRVFADVYLGCRTLPCDVAPKLMRDIIVDKRLTPIDLTRELDALPVTGLHLLVGLACALGFCFDLAEIAFGTILGAVFSAPPHVIDGALLSWLLSSVYVGAIVGAPVGGWLADRYGRRLTLLMTLLVLTVSSFGASAAGDTNLLIAARLISGLALGAYPPLMTAYLADIMPAARRGSLAMGAIAVGYLGPPILILVVRWLTPIQPLGLEAWRWGFVIGGVGSLVCALLFAAVPESPRWLARIGRPDAAWIAFERFKTSRSIMPSATPIPKPPQAPAPAGRGRDSAPSRVVFLLVIYFLTPWATVGFSLLSGAALVAKGINLQDSLLYVGVSNFGPVIGTLAGALFVDRIDRRVALCVAAAAMAVLGILFAATSSPAWLISSGLAFNLVTSLFLPVLVLYAAEMFSTTQRAGTTSLAWASNRVGSALVPLALLPLLRADGALPVFTIIGLTLAAFVSLIALFGPKGTPGLAVE